MPNSTPADPTPAPAVAAQAAAPAPQASAPAVAKRPARAAAKRVAKPATLPAAKAAPKKVAKAMPKKVAKAAPVKATKAATPVTAPAPAQAKPVKLKEKLVRDSFTMPRSDFALVQRLKDRALGFRHAAKKSELLRAGLHALMALDNDRLQAALAALPTLKAGRPPKTA